MFLRHIFSAGGVGYGYFFANHEDGPEGPPVTVPYVPPPKTPSLTWEIPG